MSWSYVYGAERWKVWNGEGDVRSHRPAKGWEAEAHLLDYDPITQKESRGAKWWIHEIFAGEKQ